jgi:hypothetical protein
VYFLSLLADFNETVYMTLLLSSNYHAFMPSASLLTLNEPLCISSNYSADFDETLNTAFLYEYYYV